MIPDRYTLWAWAREGVLGLADWLFRLELTLYEDVLGHPPTPTLDGRVLYGSCTRPRRALRGCRTACG
jgi:hypothetical protein